MSQKIVSIAENKSQIQEIIKDSFFKKIASWFSRSVQEAPRPLEMLHARAFNHMPSGCAYFKAIATDNGTPSDYIYLDINPAYTDLLGIGKEVLGKSIAEVVPGMENDRVNWIELLGNVFLNKEPQKNEYYSESLKKWFSVLIFSPKDKYFVVLLEDISKRKQIEEETRAHAIRFGRIIHSRYNPYFESTIAGEILEISPSIVNFLGYTRQEMLGKKLQDIIYVNQAVSIALVNKIIQEKTVEDYEIRLKDRAGIIKTALLSCSLELDEHGNQETILGSVMDISAIKKIEMELRNKLQELEHSNAELNQTKDTMLKQERLKNIGELTATIAHHIKGKSFANVGILAEILTMFQYLERYNTALLVNNMVGINSDKLILECGKIMNEVMKLFKVMQVSEKEISSIIKDLLLTTKQIPAQTKKTNLTKVLQETKDLMSVGLGKNNIHLDDSAVVAEHWVLASEEGLRNIFEVLFANAADAMAHVENKTITIETKKTEDNVKLTFSDNGKGIAPDRLTAMFEAFQTDKPTGTGLGLSSAKGIVEMYNGSIEVESELGKGTTFTIRIPLADMDGTEKEELHRIAIQVRKPLVDKTMASKVKVLVVDDEAGIRAYLKSTLERNGYRVWVAASVSEALKIFEERDFDKVFTDLHMPDGGGVDLIKGIRQGTKQSDIPIHILSASPLNGSIRKVMHSEGIQYLHKDPENISTIIDVVENIALFKAGLVAELQDTKPSFEPRIQDDKVEVDPINSWLGLLAHKIGNSIMSLFGFTELVIMKMNRSDYSPTNCHENLIVGYTGCSGLISQLAQFAAEYRRVQKLSIELLPRSLREDNKLKPLLSSIDGAEAAKAVAMIVVLFQPILAEIDGLINDFANNPNELIVEKIYALIPKLTKINQAIVKVSGKAILEDTEINENIELLNLILEK